MRLLRVVVWMFSYVVLYGGGVAWLLCLPVGCWMLWFVCYLLDFGLFSL